MLLICKNMTKNPESLPTEHLIEKNNIQQILFWEKIELIIELDYKNEFLKLLEQNSEKLLPKVLLEDTQAFTMFYFRLHDRWIVMSKVFEWKITITNIRMPWDGIKAMLFSIKHALNSSANEIFLEAHPQDESRTLEELKWFYNIFWFEVIEWSYMSLVINNQNLKKLVKLVKKYLETWKISKQIINPED